MIAISDPFGFRLPFMGQGLPPSPQTGVTAFANLVDPAPLAKSPPARAFSFSALGMFGLGHAIAAGDQFLDEPQSQDATQSTEQTAQLSGDGPPASHAEQIRSAGGAIGKDLAPASAPAAWDGPAVPPMLETAEIMNNAATQTEIPRATRMAPQSASEVEPDRQPSCARTIPLRQPRPVQGYFLAVAGHDTALRILARILDEAPQARGRLRWLIEQTAAEFGMSVGEFQFNGSATEPTFQQIVGGMYGDRAR